MQADITQEPIITIYEPVGEPDLDGFLRELALLVVEIAERQAVQSVQSDQKAA